MENIAASNLDGLRVDERGLETLGLAFEAIQDYAERRMRAAISAIPTGTGRAISFDSAAVA